MSLLTFDAALAEMRRVLGDLPTPQSESCLVGDAHGRILASALVSADDYPRFDNSSVDGYAVGPEANHGTGLEFRLVDSVAAGQPSAMKLRPGQTVRVLTGAPIPDGTFGVVMQEDVGRVGDRVVLSCDVNHGENIRRAATELRAGDHLLPAGAKLTSGALALAAMSGLREFPVFEVPRVCLLTIGDELVDACEVLDQSQIRDTNLPMMRAMVQASGGMLTATIRIQDDREALSRRLIEFSAQSDMVVVSGGASVGDRDFVSSTIQELGTQVFHGVSMRPGKPILFGLIDETPVFGLPGNPASTHVGFNLFVAEAIQRRAGNSRPEILWKPVRFGASHEPMGREDFVRVMLSVHNSELWAYPVFEQASYALRSLAEADGIVRLSAESSVAPGDLCFMAEYGGTRIGT